MLAIEGLSLTTALVAARDRDCVKDFVPSLTDLVSLTFTRCFLRSVSDSERFFTGGRGFLGNFSPLTGEPAGESLPDLGNSPPSKSCRRLLSLSLSSASTPSPPEGRRNLRGRGETVAMVTQQSVGIRI